MRGWRGGSVVETKVNPLQNVQRREGGMEGGPPRSPKILLPPAIGETWLCSWPGEIVQLFQCTLRVWVSFLSSAKKILILTNFIFFQKVTCGQHSCCFPAPLHKQSSVVGGGKWNSRNSFSVSAAASSFREKHVKQKVLFIGMKKNLWKVSKSIHKKMSQSYGHILYCGGERLNSIFGAVFPNITAAISVWKYSNSTKSPNLPPKTGQNGWIYRIYSSQFLGWMKFYSTQNLWNLKFRGEYIVKW